MGDGMGFFSFFKKKETEREEVSEVAIHSMPTVKADKDLFTCYDEAFFLEMKNVDGFSSSEIKKIHSIIKNGSGGFLDMSQYYNLVFEEFFKGRIWSWLEYEKWNQIFVECGKFPINWTEKQNKNFTANDVLTVDDIFGNLRVVELKDFLNLENVSFPEKIKKKDLLDLIKEIPEIKTKNIWIEKVKEVDGRKGYGLYVLLMKTIYSHTGSIYNRKSREKLGIKECKLVLIFEEDRIFINIALAKNPKALPPFFPGDTSFFRAVIPGFED